MPKQWENNEYSRGWLSRGINIRSCQATLGRVHSVFDRSRHHMLEQHGSIPRMLSSSYRVQMEKVQALLNHLFWFCVASIISCSTCVDSFKLIIETNRIMTFAFVFIIALRSERSRFYTTFPLGARGPCILIVIDFCLSFLGLATPSVHFGCGCSSSRCIIFFEKFVFSPFIFDTCRKFLDVLSVLKSL